MNRKRSSNYYAARYARNRDRVLAKRAAYYAANREKKRATIVAYRATHREENRIYCATYRATHREEKRVWNIAYLKTNIQAYIIQLLHARLSKALRGNAKSGSAVRDLGCSIEELKKHFEIRFQPGWSWAGPGRKLWQIDHIKSLAFFDLQDREQFLEAVNYKNLQPLGIEEHRLKTIKDMVQYRIAA